MLLIILRWLVLFYNAFCYMLCCLKLMKMHNSIALLYNRFFNSFQFHFVMSESYNDSRLGYKCFLNLIEFIEVEVDLEEEFGGI